MKLEDVINFRHLGNISTSGMPTAEVIQQLSRHRYAAVVNLAVPGGQPAPPSDEASLVTAQGLTYVQIPVEFHHPKLQDFQLFAALLQQLGHSKILVHCAMNYRVSVFMYLYRTLVAGVSHLEAVADLEAIWQPDEVWSDFIEEVQDAMATGALG